MCENNKLTEHKRAAFLNWRTCLKELQSDGNLMRLLIITVSIFVLMTLLNPDRFLSVRNFSSMSYQFPEFGLLSIAIMVTMLTGGIDLSAVGIANLSGIFAALLLTKYIPADAAATHTLLIVGASIGVAILTGLICGLINGVLISKIGITPILATLGTMQLFTGLAIVITKGSAVSGYPDEFLFIGNGDILGIPVPLIAFIILAIISAIAIGRTPFGFKMYMMGTNPIASRYAGINNGIVLLKTYLFSGFLSAIAGIIMISHTNSAKADYGVSYILQGILVAVLGGVNPNGGFGKISGVVLAILCLQFLSSGFNMLRFSNFFKEFIWGAVLLIIMVINYVINKRKNTSK